MKKQKSRWPWMLLVGVAAASLPLCFSVRQSQSQPVTPPTVAAVPGIYLKAFLVANAAFENEYRATRSEKRLENYNVAFSQNAAHLYVSFNPRHLSGGSDQFGGGIRYRVRRRDFKINEVRRGR